MKTSLRSVIAKRPSGPQLWMAIVREVQANSFRWCKFIVKEFEKLSLLQFKGENVDECCTKANELLAPNIIFALVCALVAAIISSLHVIQMFLWVKQNSRKLQWEMAELPSLHSPSIPLLPHANRVIGGESESQHTASLGFSCPLAIVELRSRALVDILTDCFSVNIEIPTNFWQDRHNHILSPQFSRATFCLLQQELSMHKNNNKEPRSS